MSKEVTLNRLVFDVDFIFYIVICKEEVRSAGHRRRNILYLIERYLRDNGLYDTCECLKTEARLQGDYEICDNVDLDAIYLEYASFYQVKFGKYPKILKKISTSLKMQLNTINKKPSITSSVKKEEQPKEGASLNESLQIRQLHNGTNEVTVNPMDFGVKFENHNLDDELAINGWKDLEQYAKM